jgi:ubiquinone/menaquinone biosynthesis C-methylase UbiE
VSTEPGELQLSERVEQGLRQAPYLKLTCGSADELPWPDGRFDLVHQGMLLTSILDVPLRQRIVDEMIRVTRPGGHVLWYDLIWNPVNRAAQGISLRQVWAYFVAWELVARRRVIVAPPLARRLARIGEPLIGLVEALRIVNFLELVLLRKPAAA